MPVGQSTHREVVAVIQSRSRVQLKVRSGGLIPVRNRRNEPLSWRVVTQSERGNSGVTELVRREVEVEKSPKLAQGSRAVEEVDQCTEQRLQISLQGQQGLGCSICKVRAVQQFQQLATSCGHGELRNAQTMGGGGGSCLRAANSNTNSAKSARVTQPCCQVVLDLSRPPLPTHQCHVSSAWQSLLLNHFLRIIGRDYAGHEQVAAACI